MIFVDCVIHLSLILLPFFFSLLLIIITIFLFLFFPEVAFLLPILSSSLWSTPPPLLSLPPL